MDDRRFEAARLSVLTAGERERHGIGMQMEKTLHAVFKNYVDPDPDHQEIPITGNFIADIFDGEKITEIQNGNFGKLYHKLEVLLPLYPVRVVYPVPHVKYITWIDPKTGELGARHRSPKTGNYYTAVRELYKIRRYIRDPRLTVDLVLTDMEEYRLQDGKAGNGKKGSHRFDRIPTAIADELVLSETRDYLAFLPPELPEPFTAKEFQKAGKYRPDRFANVTKFLCDEVGLLEKCGKKGNAILYRTKEAFRED